MIVSDESRLLISDSLRDVIPDLNEDQLETASSSMLIAGLEILHEGKVDIVVGKVIGLSFDSDGSVKIDIHTELGKAYDFIKNYQTTRLSCRLLYLYLGNDETRIEGPFSVFSPKIFDFDQQMSMCTLGIDLIKS